MDVPAEVAAAATARAAARAARDGPTADRLRAEIEAAGWKVVDSGPSFRLEPAHPPDVEAASGLRYGRSDAVPSRLADPATGLATVIVVAREDVAGARRAAEAVLRHSPAGVDVVVVADGLTDAAIGGLAGLDGALAGDPRLEIVRTSAPLGQ